MWIIAGISLWVDHYMYMYMYHNNENHKAPSLPSSITNHKAAYHCHMSAITCRYSYNYTCIFKFKFKCLCTWMSG